jgi:putative ATPase
LRAETLRKREVQAAVLLEEAARNRGEHKGDGEVLSWQMEAKGTEGWYRRLESGRSRVLLADRDALFEAARLKRHSRVLVANAGDGLLIWESFRRAPEGLTCGIVRNAAEKEALMRYAASLEGDERPVIEAVSASPTSNLPTPDEAKALFDTAQFDAVLAREIWRGEKDPVAAFARFAAAVHPLLAEGGIVAVLQSPPYLGQRLSAFLSELDTELCSKLSEAEEAFFKETDLVTASAWNWREGALESAFSDAGFSTKLSLLSRSEERVHSERDISAWFEPERSPWGAFVHERLGDADFRAAEALVKARAKEGPLEWRWRTALAAAQRIDN